jgi:molecular chaperone HscB
MQNHFQLFHLPQRFSLDLAALEAAYHQVQNQAHPDRFVHAGGAEKRVAMQWATRANEAYRTLRQPLPRARYLCELNGIELQTESNTAMPAPFLLRQMEWREALDEVRAQRDDAGLERLGREVDAARRDAAIETGALLDAEDFTGAAQLVRQWLFLEKFSDDIGVALEHLADGR